MASLTVSNAVVKMSRPPKDVKVKSIVVSGMWNWTPAVKFSCRGSD